jgi:hypothetical protein
MLSPLHTVNSIDYPRHTPIKHFVLQRNYAIDYQDVAGRRMDLTVCSGEAIRLPAASAWNAFDLIPSSCKPWSVLLLS